MLRFVFLIAFSVPIFKAKLQINSYQNSLLTSAFDKCSLVISDKEVSAGDFNIIDSLKNYPCSQKILSRLPYLTSETNYLFQKIFESDKETSIRFYPDFSLSKTFADGKTRTAGNLIAKYRIGINTDVLMHGTNEYILVALLHEILHVYLLHNIKLYNSGKLDSVSFKSEFRFFLEAQCKSKNYQSNFRSRTSVHC